MGAHRLPARPRQVEPDHPRRRHRLRAEAPAPRLQPQDRRLRRHPEHARGPDHHRGRVGQAAGRLAAERRGPGLRAVADGAGDRARQDGELDRRAGQGHRRQAARFRIRAFRLTNGKPDRRSHGIWSFGPRPLESDYNRETTIGSARAGKSSGEAGCMAKREDQ